MNLDMLKSIYEGNEAVRAICDHMAERSKNQNETKLHRILFHLEQDGYDFKRSDLIGAFRQLEEAGCGRYVEGRHGWKSRFVWAVKSMLVTDAATGVAPEEDIEEDADDAENAESEMIEHSYVLRQDLTVTFELPADLTRKEASRLSQFVDSLSFEEDEFR